MDILKFEINGINLYKESLIEVEFINKDNVSYKDKGQEVLKLFNRIYKKKIMAFIGINATGKTTTLNIINDIFQVYFTGQPLNTERLKSFTNILKDEATITAYFNDSDNNRVVKIVSSLKRIKNRIEIIEEVVYTKNINSKINKNNLYNFQQNHIEYIRSKLESEILKFLPKDLSIFRVLKTGEDPIYTFDTLLYTNLNVLNLLTTEYTKFPEEVIQYLDPSIEYLERISDKNDKAKTSFILKFHNQEEQRIAGFELEKIISSGTIRGLKLFSEAIEALKLGSYIIVDEIENHLNKAIVISLIELFKSDLNKKGASLIFSTHYTEIVDVLQRHDVIYVTEKEGYNIKISNLANQKIRDEIKLSSLYLSSKIGKIPTAPKYKNYIKLKRKVKKVIEDEIKKDIEDN